MEDDARRLHGAMAPDGAPLRFDLEGQSLAVVTYRLRPDLEAWASWDGHFHRMYWEVILEDGRTLVCYHETQEGGWYEDPDAIRGAAADAKLIELAKPNTLLPKRALRDRHGGRRH